MSDGWIKLHRKMLDWEWSDDPIMMSVWTHLLLDASYDENMWRGRKIERGQLVLGRKSYAKKCGVSEQQLRTVLTRLKSTNEITTKSTNKYTVVTIAKYESYQIDERTATNKSTNTATNEQPTNNQQITTTKERKKEKKEKKDDLFSLATLLFKEICPELPQVKASTSQRIKAINTWNPSEEEMRDLFSRVSASDFLSGRKSAWRADFDWVIKPDNRLKIVEGKYDNRGGEANGNHQGCYERPPGTAPQPDKWDVSKILAAPGAFPHIDDDEDLPF